MDCLKATAWLVAVLGVFSPCPTFADLPIHCMHSEVLGTWDIHLGQSTTEKDPSCGHAQPDSIMTMPERGIDFAHPHFSVKKKTTITLSNPDQAVDGNGNKGTWTMVYDEGFEVCIGDETYFTFFKYVVVSSSRPALTLVVLRTVRVPDCLPLCSACACACACVRTLWSSASLLPSPSLGTRQLSTSPTSRKSRTFTVTAT